MMSDRYNPHDAEPKWRRIWAQRAVQAPDGWSPGEFGMAGVNLPSNDDSEIGQLRTLTLADVLLRNGTAAGGNVWPAETANRAMLPPWFLSMGFAITPGDCPSVQIPSDLTGDIADSIDAYGADATRLFLLSNAPLNCSIGWSHEGLRGAGRYVQQFWRLIRDLVSMSPPTAGLTEISPLAARILKLTRLQCSRVKESLGGLRANKAVADIRTFSNALIALLDELEDAATAGEAAAFRAAAHALIGLAAPIMPHLAGECGAMLGDCESIESTKWPMAATMEAMVTLPVQINGRTRAEFTIPREWDQMAIEQKVLALAAVIKAMAGRPLKKVVVVPLRIVNVVF